MDIIDLYIYFALKYLVQYNNERVNKYLLAI